MILDARQSETQIDRTADVVVVGAGPVGVVLARELAGFADVLVIEAGGGDATPWLLEGESGGLGYHLETARARQLGGSSTLWAGYCAAFGHEDFVARSWLPLSGWPIGPNDLVPFHLGASEAMGVMPQADDEGGPGGLRTGRWTFARATRRFADDVPALAKLPGVSVLHHASVVDLKLAPSHDSVREVTLHTANGRTGSIRCRQLVLACGGIETPRLLLAANRQVPDGIGNAGDMVGRCFMEHPHRIMQGVRLKNVELFERSASRTPVAAGHDEMLNFSLPAQVRERHGILNARVHAFRLASMAENEAPLLGLMMEQAPNPASRITLSHRTDRVGLPLARLDWVLGETDHKSFIATAEAVGTELERAGLAHVVGPEDKEAAVGYCCHQLGTTRMSDDPATGVTDRDCRVHGIDNLYIAGGSVFATSSWANPTFTALTLALRLAHRLRNGTAEAVRNRIQNDRELVL